MLPHLHKGGPGHFGKSCEDGHGEVITIEERYTARIPWVGDRVGASLSLPEQVPRCEHPSSSATKLGALLLELGWVDLSSELHVEG